MTFRANSMTYRIDPEMWDSMAAYRLKSEFEEFSSWLCSNVDGLSRNEAAVGRALLLELKELLEENNIDTSAYGYLEGAANDDDRISLFPAR